MNKQGFILYEALLMLVILSTILILVLKVNNELSNKHVITNKKIDALIKERYESTCNLACLIKKAL